MKNNLYICLATLCLTLSLYVLPITVFAEEGDLSKDITVSITEEGKKNPYALKKKIKARAKAEAVKTYITRINKNIGQETIRNAMNEADNFVEDEPIEQNSEWLDINKDEDYGQLTVTYSVRINVEELNRYFEEQGVTLQASTEVVIMEEPPSLGQIKINEENLGDKFFLKNYTSFQRRIRDAIIKKADDIGLKIVLLQDKDEFKQFKDKDDNLVGTYYDAEKQEFAIHRDLLDAIKQTYPDTIVIYYRIDTLDYDKENAKLNATISLNLKKLSDNSTKSLGSHGEAEAVTSKTADGIINSFGKLSSRVIGQLMNLGKGKINSMLMAINNAPDQLAMPIKLSLNGAVFEEKVRKRTLYEIKKQIIAKNLATEKDCVLRNDNLTVTFPNEKGKADDFYFEKLTDVLKEAGAEVDDDKVSFNENVITVKQ